MKGRLRRLEQARGLRNQCPECGGVPGGPNEFTFAERGSHEEPKNCPSCGLPRWFTFNLARASAREDSYE